MVRELILAHMSQSVKVSLSCPKLCVYRKISFYSALRSNKRAT